MQTRKNTKKKSMMPKSHRKPAHQPLRKRQQRDPVVRIFPFIAPEADMSGNRLNRDIAAANEIFSRCGITVVLGAQPVTLTDTNYLFTNNMPVDPSNNPFQNLNTGVSDTDLPVFYVGGDYLSDRHSIGNAAYRWSSTNGVITSIKRMILMTNGAGVKTPVDYVKYAFAHEVAHSLLVRQSGNTVIDTDPSGPYLYPNGFADTAHDNDPNNILYPIVPGPPNHPNPAITQQQCTEAHRSTLLK